MTGKSQPKADEAAQLPAEALAVIQRHHKREFEDAQVNYGEVFLIWDHLFGTFHDAARSPGRGEVGLRSEMIPPRSLEQLRWPFLAHRDR